MEITTFGPLWSTVVIRDWTIRVHNVFNDFHAEIIYKGKTVAALQRQDRPQDRLFYPYRKRDIPADVENIATALVLGANFGKQAA